MAKLQFSIPANNQKIIELYNKIKKEELDPSPDFQRKLVWRKQHKFKFIETILMNFPFPEIYIAPGEIDTESLILKDLIVDGQQRLTTIANYIESKNVFALDKIPIKKFHELDKEEKEDFLNYEVSVRYLKNVDKSQISEIFQRINSSEYALNSVERLNAQWGDSEFVIFAKQIVEKDLDIDLNLINYKVKDESRIAFINFFHKKYSVFTENDINRMLSLQYILTLLATLCEGEYFRRNEKVQSYIESYFDEFLNAGEIESTLLDTTTFIDSLELSQKSYWFNKANMFTLVCEIYKFDIESIDVPRFKEKLEEIEQANATRMFKEVIENSDIELEENLIIEDISSIYSQYLDYAREAVNEKYAREYRGNIIRTFLIESIKDSPEEDVIAS